MRFVDNDNDNDNVSTHGCLLRRNDDNDNSTHFCTPESPSYSQHSSNSQPSMSAENEEDENENKFLFSNAKCSKRKRKEKNAHTKKNEYGGSAANVVDNGRDLRENSSAQLEEDENENIFLFSNAKCSKRKRKESLQNEYGSGAANVGDNGRNLREIVCRQAFLSQISIAKYARNNHRRCAKSAAAPTHFFTALSKTAAFIFPTLQFAAVSAAAASLNAAEHIVNTSSLSPPTITTNNNSNDASPPTHFKEIYQQLALTTTDARATIGTSTVVSAAVATAANNISASAGSGPSSFMHMRLALTITHLLLVSLGSVNLLVIFIILLRPYMRSITNVYMLSLCLADFIYLTNLSLVAATQLNEKSWPFGDVMCIIYHGTETTGKYASVLFVVLLAVDRYYCMCKVNECARYRNFRVAIILSLVAWSAAILAAFPLYYFAEVALLQFRNLSKIHKLCIAKWPSSDSARWYITVSSVLIFALPLVLIIFCYYHILNKMREALKRCKRMRRGARSSAPYHRVTRLVLWVVVFHVICWSPFWLFNLFSSIFRLRISTQFDRIVINIIHLFPYVNCALNPLLYAIHAENFRTAFRSLFCRGGDEGVATNAGGQQHSHNINNNNKHNHNNYSSNAESTIGSSVRRANSASEAEIRAALLVGGGGGSVYRAESTRAEDATTATAAVVVVGETCASMNSVILNGYAPVLPASAFPRPKNSLQYNAGNGHAHAGGDGLISNRINPLSVEQPLLPSPLGHTTTDSVSSLADEEELFHVRHIVLDSHSRECNGSESADVVPLEDANTVSANSVAYSLMSSDSSNIDSRNANDCRKNNNSNNKRNSEERANRRAQKRDTVRELFRTLSFLPRRHDKTLLMRHGSELTSRGMPRENVVVNNISTRRHTHLKVFDSGGGGGGNGSAKDAKCTVIISDDKFV